MQSCGGMIVLEWVETRTYQFVPKDRGQLLCSSIDPVGEAKKWFEKNFSNRNESYEVVFILGLAGGFHVSQVASAFFDAEIVVVEPNFELTEELLSRRGKLPDNVTLLSGMKIEEVKRNVFVRSGLRSRYKVASYPTSFRLDREYYEKIQKFLIGRDLASFQAHLETRIDQKHFFESLLAVQPDLLHDNITVLDIERAIRKRAKPLEHEGMVWMALRELVK